MTHFSNFIGPSGPILIVWIGISAPRQQAMVHASLKPHLPLLANMLIDTGASHTSIDQKYVGLLSLQPTGSTLIHTPSTGATPQTVATYDVGLVVNGIANAIHILPAQPVFSCDFSAQGIDGLIGRDVLAAARLTYSGPDNMYYLSF